MSLFGSVILTPGQMWKMYRVKIGTSYNRRQLITAMCKYIKEADTARDYFMELIKTGHLELSFKNPLGAKNMDYYLIKKPFTAIHDKFKME